MRLAFTLLLGIGLASALAAQPDDPTPDEQAAITAAKLLKAKTAAIDAGLPKDARVSVKFVAATDATLLALAKHPSVGSIQALDATACTAKGFTALQALPNLRRLVLNKSGVDDKELAAIAGFAQLRALVIPESAVTDAGLASLAKLTRLVALDISDNPKISDKGMVHVKALERLEVLLLTKTAITDKGLLELKALDGLRTLNVAGTKVTAAAAEAFPDDMPNLRVVRR